MSSQIDPDPGNLPAQVGVRRFLPNSTLGWITVILTLAALASWLVFPLITMAYREKYPLVDSWVMPALATTMVDAAVVLNLVTVLLRRERSTMSIITLVFTIIAGLFFTVIVVGEAIGGM